jgi:hypothetical protein
MLPGWHGGEAKRRTTRSREAVKSTACTSASRAGRPAAGRVAAAAALSMEARWVTQARAAEGGAADASEEFEGGIEPAIDRRTA